MNLIWNQFCYFSFTCIAKGTHFQQPLKKFGSNSSTSVQIYSSNVYLEHFYHFTRVIIFELENLFNFLAVISLYKSKSTSILAKPIQRRKKTPPFNNVVFHIFNWNRKYLLGSWKSVWKKLCNPPVHFEIESEPERCVSREGQCGWWGWLFKIHYVHIWKCHNEALYFV